MNKVLGIKEGLKHRHHQLGFLLAWLYRDYDPEGVVDKKHRSEHKHLPAFVSISALADICTFDIGTHGYRRRNPQL